MPITDPRVPAAEQCVLRCLLEKHAESNPGAPLAVFENGTRWSYSETLEKVRRVAAGLQKLGVKQGDHVLGWMPTGGDCLCVWLATNYLGAIFVPANLAYKGKLLEHVIYLSDAKVGVVHTQLASRLKDVDLHLLRDVVIIGGEPIDEPRVTVHDVSVLEECDNPTELQQPIEPWDTPFIIFTSGTTGPSKAVLCSYVQVWTQFVETFSYINGRDRALLTLPMFHTGGLGLISMMIAVGGSVAFTESFKTSTFWQMVDSTESTFCALLGVMTPFLLSEPPSPDDKKHTMRYGVVIPWGEDSLQFAERFDVKLQTFFNMTEICTPILSEFNPSEVGLAGKLRDGFEVRIVDENDCEVPANKVGELVVRSDRPWAMNSGYYKNPEATARAWRNGWFHTGDAFRVDESGTYYFVDRIKDAIRRRGENISSFEVEAEVQMHPAVREAAAIPVKSTLSEDEVMVCISLVSGDNLDPVELLDFLKPRLPHFMIPRYVRVLDELPKTPTAKVQKVLLKEQGVTADTWDREAAGIKIQREKFV